MFFYKSDKTCFYVFFNLQINVLNIYGFSRSLYLPNLHIQGHNNYIVLCSPLVALHWHRNGWPWMTLNGHFAIIPSELAGKWPDRHQTCTRSFPGKPALHPGCPQGQGQLIIRWALSLWLAGKFPAFSWVLEEWLAGWQYTQLKAGIRAYAPTSATPIPSVRHTRVLYQNGWTYHRNSLTIW